MLLLSEKLFMINFAAQFKNVAELAQLVEQRIRNA